MTERGREIKRAFYAYGNKLEQTRDSSLSLANDFTLFISCSEASEIAKKRNRYEIVFCFVVASRVKNPEVAYTHNQQSAYCLCFIY